MSPSMPGYHWIPSTIHHDLPTKAVVAGQNADGSTNYVAITTYFRDQLVVNLVHSKRLASLSLRGWEINVQSFQVLVGDGFTWHSMCDDRLPDAAVSCGYLADMEKCYIGRAMHEGCMLAGKILMSHRCLYVPFGGDEHRKETFEVLLGPRKRTGLCAWLTTPFRWLVKLCR